MIITRPGDPYPDRIHYLQTRALTLQLEAAADPTSPWASRYLEAAEACERLVYKYKQEWEQYKNAERRI